MGLVSPFALALPGWTGLSAGLSLTISRWAPLVQHPGGGRRFASDDPAPVSLAASPVRVGGLYTHRGPASSPRAVIGRGYWAAGVRRAAP